MDTPQSTSISSFTKIALARAGQERNEKGLTFKNAEKTENINGKIHFASQRFLEIADIEENAYNRLAGVTAK